jgi:hypothetical protein
MNDHRIRTALTLVHSDEFKPRDPDTRFSFWPELCALALVFLIIFGA